MPIDIKDPTKGPNSYGMVKYALAALPRQVRIETSSFCNSACSFCMGHGEKGMTRRKGKMGVDLFTLIVEDIASWPGALKEVVPTNYGELFLNKYWPQMLEMLAKQLPNTEIVIVTTGTLLTPEVLERLALTPTLKRINFSINAWFVETWVRIHKLPAKYMTMAVQAVHKMRDRRPDVQVQVSMVYNTERITEIEKDLFSAYCSGQVFQVNVNYESFAGHPTKVPEQVVILPCRSVFDGLTIFDDGQVGTNCCFDGDSDPELNIGRFPTQSLLEIWRGEKLKRLGEIHNSGRRAELGLCKTCSFA